MANYPAYQFQPQMAAYGQQPMYQQPMQMSMQDQMLFCRMAASRDEVTAFPTDFSGKPLTFIGPQAQVVWIKTFNPATGGSNVEEYRKTEQAVEQPKFATMGDLEQVLELIRRQGEEIAQLRGQNRRRAAREDEGDAV